VTLGYVRGVVCRQRGRVGGEGSEECEEREGGKGSVGGNWRHVGVKSR
jgi:hypothetical protein